MNEYCCKLDLPIHPFKDGFDIFHQSISHIGIDLKHINPSILDLVDSRGLKIFWMELFHRRPGDVGVIHIDGEGGDYTKINWVYGGRNSEMRWFSLKDPSYGKSTYTTVANTSYRGFNPAHVELRHSERMVGPYIVQVGLPHQIVNPVEDRFCVCITLGNKTGGRTTMIQAQTALRDLLI